MSTSLRSEMTTANGETHQTLTVESSSSAAAAAAAQNGGPTTQPPPVPTPPQPQQLLAASPCLVDGRTGQQLTLAQAVEAGIVDLSRGLFLNPVTGQSLTLTEAANAGLMEAGVCAALSQPLGGGGGAGLRDPRTGRGVPTLLEAAQLGLYDATTGRFVDPKTKQTISVQQAVEMGLLLQEQVSTCVALGLVAAAADGGPPTLAQALALGWVDLSTGQVCVPHTGVRCSLHEAFVSDVIASHSDWSGAPAPGAVALYDALAGRLVDPLRATFHDRSSGQRPKLADAVAAGLVDERLVSVWDTLEQRRLTLRHAVESGVVDLVQCRYTDRRSGRMLDLAAAFDAGRIVKPLTLKDCVDLQLVAADGSISDACTGAKLTLLQAVQRCILDTQSPSVTDSATNEALTLVEALARGVVTPSGRYVDASTTPGAVLSLAEAADRGFISTVTRKMIFDVDGFKDPSTGRYVSFNAAVDSGLLDLATASYLVSADQRLTLAEATGAKLTQAQIVDVLDKPVGIRDAAAPARELSVLQAVQRGFIDRRTGQLTSAETPRRRLSLTEALACGLISQDGAAFYNSLLNIVVRSSVVKRSVMRTIRVSPLDAQQLRLNIELAIGRGLIDEEAGTYRDPATGRVMSLQEAVDGGFFGAIRREAPAEAPPSPSPSPSPSPRRRVTVLPPSGWRLAEAIEQKLLDPTTGLFAVPGTDRLVTFEECVVMNIVDVDSATVLDPSSNRHVALSLALTKKLVTSTGHYVTKGGQSLSLAQAIDQQLILCHGTAATTGQAVDRDADPGEEVGVVDAPDQVDLEDIVVGPGVVFSPATGMVLLEESGDLLDLLTAVKQNKVQAGKVKVKDPTSGKELTIAEAIRKGIVSKESGEYKQTTGRRLSMVDAVHTGAVAVAGRRVSEAAPVTEAEPPAAAQAAPWKDVRIKLIDPLTGAQVTWEGAIERKILDVDSVLQFASVLGSADSPKLHLSSDLLSTIVVSDAASGQQVSAQQALDEGLLTEQDVAQLIQEQQPVYLLMDATTTAVALDDGDGQRRLSLADQTRLKITTEPKFSVAIGRARSLSQDQSSPSLRIRRRVLKPRQAADRGLIDRSTADVLESPPESLAALPESLHNVGAISDIMRGEQVTIGEALERGILDASNGELQFPVASSVWADQVVERGLYDAASRRFIHPETGALLGLLQALQCDIIDPRSLVVDLRSGRTLTLTVAVSSGLVDAETGCVFKPPPDGSVAFADALHQGLYRRPNVLKSPLVPPVALTLPVALQRRLIDADALEMIHPSMGRRLPLQRAIDESLLMDVPYPAAPHCVHLMQALQAGLLDVPTAVFTDPTTEEKVNVFHAMAAGLLAVRPSPDAGLVSNVATTTDAPATTETLVSAATHLIRKVDLVPGYALIGGQQVRDERTGRLLPLEQARRWGLVVGVAADCLPMSEAVDQGLVDVARWTFCPPATKRRVLLDDALQRNLVALDGVWTRLSPWSGRALTAQTLLYDRQSRRTISAAAAVDAGLLDAAAGRYRDAAAATWTSLADALSTGLVVVVGVASDADADDDPVLVSLTAEAMANAESAAYPTNKTSLRYALKEKRIDAEDCTLVLADATTAPLEEALRSGRVDYDTVIAIEEGGRSVAVLVAPVPVCPVDVLDRDFAVENGLYDPAAGSFVDVDTGRAIRLVDAVALGTVDGRRIEVRDLRCNGQTTLEEALENGLVDAGTGAVTDFKSGGKALAFYEAVRLGWIQASDEAVAAKLGRAVAFKAALDDQWYDVSSGLLTLPPLRTAMPLAKALQRGLVDADSIVLRDHQSGDSLSLARAQQLGRFDSKSGTVLLAGAEAVSLSRAVQLGVVQPQRPVLSLEAVLRRGLYDAESGRIGDSVTGRRLTMAEAIRWGLVDGFVSQVVDTEGDGRRTLCLQDALDCGLIDDERGRLKDAATGQWLDLNDALTRGLVTTASMEEQLVVPLASACSLPEALRRRRYDAATGLLAAGETPDTQWITLRAAVQQGLVDAAALTVKDPRSADLLTLADAIQAGIIDDKSGMALDPTTGAEMDFLAAVERGLMVTARRRLSVTEAVAKGLFDSKSRRFSGLPTDVALRGGLIEASSNLVKDYASGKLMTFQQAVEGGLVDPRRGTVRVADGDGARVHLEEALDLGLLVEVVRPLSVSQALVKQVYDVDSGLFLEPSSGRMVTLSQAIESNLIDPESVHVQDTSSGFLRKISLGAAIDLGLVDGRTACYVDPETGQRYTLAEALQRRLVVDSKAPVSIQRMIHQGLYDEASGKLLDPNTGKPVTVHQALRRYIVHPSLPCFFDAVQGRPLSLVETCRAGIIDRQTGRFRLPASDPSAARVDVSLQQALDAELMVDIERAFSLYDALRVGLFDESGGCFVHPTNGRRLNLDAACKEDVVDAAASIVRHSGTKRFMKLDEAVASGLIDSQRSVYRVPDSVDEELTLVEALRRRLIVTSKKGLTLEEAIKNGLYSAETGKLVDPSLGDWLDLNQALEHGLVDASTTALVDVASGGLKSLNSGLQDGDVDGVRGRLVESKTKRCIGLEAALERGLIVTVDRALTFEQAIRGGAIDLRQCTFVDPRTQRQYTLEQAIRLELIDPESAVVKSPRTGRFTALKRAIQEGVIDLKRRAVFDPYTGRLAPLCIIFEQGTVVFHRQPLSLDQAIDDGRLNMSTGRFLEAASGEELSLQQAVVLGCIDADSALVRDTLRKKHVALSQAWQLGLIDADRPLVLNTSNGQQVALDDALATGLVVTAKRAMSLIEALQFGLYSTETGLLTDPFGRVPQALSQHLASGRIEAASTMVKDPDTGRIVTLTQAVETRLVDAESGRVLHGRGRQDSVDFAEAFRRRWFLTLHDRVRMLLPIHCRTEPLRRAVRSFRAFGGSVSIPAAF